MKILLTADFHARKSWFKWVADHAVEFDVIAYAGDFLDLFGQEPLESQIRWIVAWAAALPRPLVWCPGNHDVEPSAPISSGRWMRALSAANLFNMSWQERCRGMSFIQIGWRSPIPHFVRRDIVLAHAPPAGTATACRENGVDCGDLDLADALLSTAAEPWLVLSGHIHTPKRWVDICGRTIVLNPGVTELAAAPNHIVISSTAKTAALFVDGDLKEVARLSKYALAAENN